MVPAQARVLEQIETLGGQPSLEVGQRKEGLDYRMEDLSTLHGLEYWELEPDSRIDTCL